MPHASEVHFDSRLPGDLSPEACLDAKLKAMAAARARRSVNSILPDLDSLPQPGGRQARSDVPTMKLTGQMGEHAGCYGWVDRHLAIAGENARPNGRVFDEGPGARFRLSASAG